MKFIARAILLLTILFPASVFAQSQPAADRFIDIFAVIDAVADDIGKEIIVDPRIHTMRQTVGENEISYASRPTPYTTAGEVDYESLRALLRAIQFVVIESDDQIRIVPEQNARSEPSRILQEDDSRVSDHEIVTRVIKVPQELTATQLVPVLRPTMPQAAMLGAVPNTNTLYVVDYYDNVRRITRIIEEIADSVDN